MGKDNRSHNLEEPSGEVWFTCTCCNLSLVPDPLSGHKTTAILPMSRTPGSATELYINWMATSPYIAANHFAWVLLMKSFIVNEVLIMMSHMNCMGDGGWLWCSGRALVIQQVSWFHFCSCQPSLFLPHNITSGKMSIYI